MTGIILAAGYATRMYPLTQNTPKPLLAVGGKPILTRLFEDLDANCGIDRYILVSNHKFIASFERWLDETAHIHPVELIDDGSTADENRLGAVNDLCLAADMLKEPDDLFVCAADNVLDFSLASLSGFFRERAATVIFRYREPDEAKRRRSGVVQLEKDDRVIGFEEKPDNPKSEYVALPFYIISAKDVPLIRRAVEGGINTDAPGSLIGYLVNHTDIYALDMPGNRYDVGNLETYERLKNGY